MSKLLLDDKPLLLLPSLAIAIGVNEAILIQQLHYWLQESQHVHKGHKWIYNTYEDWNKQFPFWSVKTIKRIMTKLENSKLVISDNFNKKKFDKTKWYRIDYQKLEYFSSAQMGYRWGQLDPTKGTDCPDDGDNLTRPIPESSSEISSDIENDDEECAQESKCDVSDGVPTTVPEMVEEVSLSPDEIGQEIEQRYIQLRATGLFLSAKDIQAIHEIANYGIILSDAIQWLDESFALFKPKFSGDKINSFAYCKTHILNRAYEKQERSKAKNSVEGGKPTHEQKIHKYSRGNGRSTSKTAEQALREAEAARRAWGAD